MLFGAQNWFFVERCGEVYLSLGRRPLGANSRYPTSTFLTAPRHFSWSGSLMIILIVVVIIPLVLRLEVVSAGPLLVDGVGRSDRIAQLLVVEDGVVFFNYLTFPVRLIFRPQLL